MGMGKSAFLWGPEYVILGILANGIHQFSSLVKFVHVGLIDIAAS